MPNRRDVLGALAASVAAATLPRVAAAQREGHRLAVADLDEGLALLGGAGANIVVAHRASGLLLVDGGLEERAPALLSLLAERYAGAAPTVLVNTNWRAEHTGGNEALARAGAEVYAHENTKLWLGADFFVKWEGRRYLPRPQAAWPTKTFYASSALAFGDDEVRLVHLPRAHTDGDVVVFFPRRNVLVASDLLAVGRFPVLDYSTGGWIGGFASATRALLELCDADTRIVPAEGPVQRRSALEEQLTLATALRERVVQAYRGGASFEDFLAMRPAAEFESGRGDPSQFLAQVYEGAWGHVRQLGGVI